MKYLNSRNHIIFTFFITLLVIVQAPVLVLADDNPAAAIPGSDSPASSTDAINFAPEPLAAAPAKPASSVAGSPSPALNEIVVTGTRIETETINVPADVRVIGQERLARPGTSSTLEALREVSGVKMNPRQEGATFMDLEARGLASNSTSGGNILIMLDGIPQRRLSFGGPYMGALPYYSITRLELVKGPMSSLYGRNALAGALQLFSDPGSAAQQFNLRTSYEHPTDSKRLAVRSSGPLNLDLAGLPSTYSLTGSLNQSTGWQPRNKLVKDDLYLHLNLNLSNKDRLTVLAGFFDTDEEYVAPVFVDEDGDLLDGFERKTNLSVPGQNSLALNEYRLALRYHRQWLRQFKTIASLAFWRGDSFWKVGRPDDQPAEGTLTARSASDRRFLEKNYFAEIEGILNYLQTEWLDASVNFGASYENLTYIMTKVDITTQEAFGQTGDYSLGIPYDLATGVEPGRSSWIYSDESRRDTFEEDMGAFLKLRFEMLDRVFLHGGLRYDKFDRTQKDPATGDEANHNDWAISPGVGLNVAVFTRDDYRLNLYTNWGRGFSPIFRAVNNTQFADVDPETSESVDLGLKSSLLNRLIEGSVVFYRIERQDIVAMNPDTLLQENIGDWTITGVETDLRFRPFDELVIYAGYTWREPEITNNGADPTLEGNKIPMIPDQTLSLGAKAQGPCGNGIGSEARYVGAQYGNEQNSFELPAYLIWDAWIAFRINDAIRASVYAKNLLDAEYYTAAFNGVKNGSAFAGSPRTYGIGIDGRF